MKRLPEFLAGWSLSLILACLTLPFPLSAQESDNSGEKLFDVEEEVKTPEWQKEVEKKLQDAPLKPEEYVTSGAKHPQRISESPSAITVIDEDEIRAYGVITLEELLRIVPGVDLKEVSPAFKELGIRSFHTSTGNTVLLLIDGQEINLNFFGGIFWSMLPISLDDVKRIEVIRGPGSALYGANAFCGVINIQTKSPRDLKTATLLGDYGLYDGERGLVRGKLKIAHSLSRISFSASGDFDQAQSWDFPAQTKYRLYRTRFITVAEPTGESRVQLDGGWFTGDQHSYIYFGDMHFTHQHTAYLDTVASWKNLKFQAYWRRYQADVTIRTPAVLLAAIFSEMSAVLDNLEGRLEYSIWLPARNHLTMGTSYIFNIFESNSLAREYNDEQRQGFFLQDEWNPIPLLLLTLGLRYDLNSITDPAFSPRLSGVYSLDQKHSLRFSFGQAFRKPSFYEYGMQLQKLADLGPPYDQYLKSENVKNERLLAWELGYVGHLHRRLELAADFFYYQLLDALTMAAGGTYSYRNYPHYADAIGGELALKFFPLNNLDGFANYAYVYTWDHATPENPIFQQVETLYPHHQIKLGLKYKPAPALSLSAGYQYNSTTRDFIIDPDLSIIVPTDAPNEEIGPNHILNFRVGYQAIRGRLEAGIKGFNVLTSGSRQFPGIVWTHADQETGEDISESFSGEGVRRTIIFFLEASL